MLQRPVLTCDTRLSTSVFSRKKMTIFFSLCTFQANQEPSSQCSTFAFPRLKYKQTHWGSQIPNKLYWELFYSATQHFAPTESLIFMAISTTDWWLIFAWHNHTLSASGMLADVCRWYPTEEKKAPTCCAYWIFLVKILPSRVVSHNLQTDHQWVEDMLTTNSWK